MVRVLDGNVRAFLSDSYRAIDNYDVASHALRTLQDCGGRVIEASLSDSKMRIKMISPEIWETIERKRTSAPSSEWYAGGLGNAKHLARVAANSVGNLPMHGGPDTVNPLGELGNSETGHGGLYYKGGILQAICFNLATVQEVLRNVHLGSRQDIGHMTQETIRKEADVIFSKLRDTVSAFFTAESFRAIVEQCRATAGQVLLAPSMAIGALVESDDRLGDDDLLKLVDHLSGQPVDEATVYDVGQAVSRYAQDTADDDMAIDLEALAGEILTGKHSRVLVEAS